MNAPSFLRLALPWKRRRLAGQFRRARTLEADAPFVPRSAPKRISGSSLAIVFLAQILAAPHRLYGQTQAATNSPAPGEIRIVTLAELVEISPAGASSWIRIQTAQTVHPGDRIRTGPKSRAILRWSDQSIVSMDELTDLEILQPDSARPGSGLNFIEGFFSFFHRGKPGRFRVISHGTVAGIEGTEFAMRVREAAGSKRTTLSVIDGRVRFENDVNGLLLTSGEEAVAQPGAAPSRTAGFIANNLLQWCFYYPGVLVPEDLRLSAVEQSDLATSLRSYRDGDLLAALANYPDGRTPASEADSLYHAALLLSVGQVAQTEDELVRLEAANPSDDAIRIADALRVLIAAVKFQVHPTQREPQLATELLAASYYAQSRTNSTGALADALDFAKRAATKAPQSGFAWERVAELEFSFGRSGRALENLNKSLELSPRNAQGLALKGFLLAAQNQTKQAIVWFDRALQVDGHLANAWLGRGLCRIRRGDATGGREDLLMAAALEPQRSALRSYLGKAYKEQGDFKRAEKELQLAEKLDPGDPTSWLYSALLKQQQNRINDAIHDLEKSEELNDNRSVYRSSLLLDQDRAARSANLAGIYRDAGMYDVSVREAVRAVNYDYGNYSAHLFLADSYNQSVDFNSRRYETAAETEFLIANLLAPASGGTIFPGLSQQEYSGLLEKNQPGLISSTEYLSRGAWSQFGAIYGVLGNFSYDFDADYIADNGQRPNNDLDLRRFAVQAKQQVTPQDSFFLRISDLRLEEGDLAQYYDPSSASTGLRIKETQQPIATLGYTHQWAPGLYTVALANYLDDTFSLFNPTQPAILAFQPFGSFTAVRGLTMQETFRNSFDVYSGEIEQIWQTPHNNAIMGARFQSGSMSISNLQELPSDFGSAFDEPAASQKTKGAFRRFSIYGYDFWNITERFQLLGGIAYDSLRFPENFQIAPVSNREKTMDQISPKAGFIWSPITNTIVRFAYTRSLGGASIDQSYRLEPSQLAGFVQAFRTIIPESIGGGSPGSEFETFGLSLETRFPTHTYLGISAEILNSRVERTTGAFLYMPFDFDFALPSGLRERLDYQEKSLSLTLNQLVGQGLSAGVRYRVSAVNYIDNFIDIPTTIVFSDFVPRQHSEGVLHTVDSFLIYNHPCGIFAQFDARWWLQSNGTGTGLPDSHFWQFNFLAGYRFPGRHVEVSAGVVNMLDQDYRLNPLTLYSDPPRRRTFVAALRLNF